MPVIRLAMPPTDAASQGYYAQQKGFFKNVGLNVQILKTNEGASVAAAVAGGTADIGQSNLSSLCAAHERGLPFVAIAGSNLFVSTTHQSELVVAPDSPYHTARDFNGKTIARGRAQEHSGSRVQHMDGYDRRQLDLDQDRRAAVCRDGRGRRERTRRRRDDGRAATERGAAGEARAHSRRRRWIRSAKSGSSARGSRPRHMPRRIPTWSRRLRPRWRCRPIGRTTIKPSRANCSKS